MGCGASSNSDTAESKNKSRDGEMQQVGPSDEGTTSQTTESNGHHREANVQAERRKSMQDFSFGDNGGATTVGEESTGDIHPSAESPAPAPGSRRIAVSAEPILPDAAEQFHPRYIEKDAAAVQALRDSTSRSYLFAALEPEELTTVIGAMEREMFPKGTEILQQGHDSTEKFYFIVEGTVDILKREVKEHGGLVCSFSKGQTFGELELMYLAPCAATVRCATDVVVYSIDRDTYRHIVMMVSIRKRRLYKELLSAVPFLKGMTDYDAMTLADALTPVTFQPGEAVLTFGARSEWMYIIVSGTVKVVGRDPNDEAKKVDVCELSAGETLGELEFLHGHPAVADCVVTSSGPLKACKLHRAHFEMCMGPVVEFLKKNADTDKYQYYHNVVTPVEGGNGAFAHFTFGEAQEYTAFDAGGASPGPETSDSASPHPAKPEKARRIAVSDESAEEADENWQPPVCDKTAEQKHMLKDTLRQNPLLAHMEARDVDTVIDAMQPLSYPAGTLILTQGGDGGTHYYIITKGVVEILKKDKLICTFSVGQGFGEMELMYIQPCVASVKARTDVDTWAIDRPTYKKLVMQLAIKRRHLYSELLSKIEFLAQMDEYDRNTLADALSPAEYQTGESLIRRGETNDWMYIIIDGRVEVLGVDENNENARKHICYLERGACVGELEFLNQHRAVADCIAAEPLRVAKLHRDHFELCMGPVVDVLRRTVRQEKYQYYQQQLEELNSAGSGNETATAAPTGPRRRRAKGVSAGEMEALEATWTPPEVPKSEAELQQLQTLLRKAPLFAAMPPADRDVVIKALSRNTFAKDTVLVAQGEVPDEAYWYIVENGTAEQRVADEHGHVTVVATYGPGHAFGELELMYTTPAAATTVAASDLTVFRLDRNSYRKIVMKLSTERRALYKELLSGVPFLARLSEAQQDTIADALSPVHFNPGDYLIRFGSLNDWMYILADGVVEVFSKAGEKVCDLRRGEMVGELEFLHHHAAVADCVAKTHVSACRLHRDHFELCLGPVGDYIEQTLKQVKYSYYNAVQKKNS